MSMASEGSEPIRLQFSGDVGPDHKLLQSDPDGPQVLDSVILEATYSTPSAPHR